MYKIPEDHSQILTISSFDSDRERRLSLSSQLKLQQEVGELHLQSGGMPYSKLYELGKVWILTRARSVRHCAPSFEDRVRLTTWSKQIKGAQFFRAYEFRSEDGRPLISSISSFALVDARTHAILRPSVLDGVVDFSCNPEREIGCALPERIQMSGDVVGKYTREVRYTDIDYNHHLNNAVYCDFIADYLPEDFSEVDIVEFEVNFLKEALLGDELEITVLREGDLYCYLGEHEKGICFTAKALIRRRR